MENSQHQDSVSSFAIEDYMASMVHPAEVPRIPFARSADRWRFGEKSATVPYFSAVSVGLLPTPCVEGEFDDLIQVQFRSGRQTTLSQINLLLAEGHTGRVHGRSCRVRRRRFLRPL